MSEFVLDGYEELRPFGEIMDDLRDRAGEMLGRIGTRMGLGEAAIAYSTEDGESVEGSGTADMADEEKKEPEIIVEDKEVDGKNVHIESLAPGSAGPGTGEGIPVENDKK